MVLFPPEKGVVHSSALALAVELRELRVGVSAPATSFGEIVSRRRSRFVAHRHRERGLRCRDPVRGEAAFERSHLVTRDTRVSPRQAPHDDRSRGVERGCNPDVVSEPGHRGRFYRVATRAEESRYVDPDAWLAQATRREGSWWPEWMEWLSARSGAEVTPPQLGTEGAPYRAIAEAPEPTCESDKPIPSARIVGKPSIARSTAADGRSWTLQLASDHACAGPAPIGGGASLTIRSKSF